MPFKIIAYGTPSALIPKTPFILSKLGPTDPDGITGSRDTWNVE